MGCIQVLLAILGIVVFCMGSIRLGGQVCRGGSKNLVGLVLVLQAALVFGFWFVIGFQEGMKSAKAGRSSPNMAAIERMHEKYQWVDVVVPVGALCLAGLLLYAGLKDPPQETEWDEPTCGGGRYDDFDDRYDQRNDTRGRGDRY